jgi:hypothetical protein
MFSTLGKANTDTGNIWGLNLAEVKLTTVQVTAAVAGQLMIRNDLLY